MFLKTFVVAAFILSCAIGPSRPHFDQRPVWGVGAYQTILAWEATPWYRVQDSVTEFPIFVVISTDGQACKVDAAAWVLAMPNEPYHCASGWIPPRSR